MKEGKQNLILEKSLESFLVSVFQCFLASFEGFPSLVFFLLLSAGELYHHHVRHLHDLPGLPPRNPYQGRTHPQLQEKIEELVQLEDHQLVQLHHEQ